MSHQRDRGRLDPICLFLGPSLDPREASEQWAQLDQRRPAAQRRQLVVVPPIKQGDLIRLVDSHMSWSAIGIVDGVLRQSPAVSHKEILYAMKRGVWIYGASSMGALRAAECDRFGMVGVGRIYRDFRDGILQDDDEVVVAHASDPDTEYYACSSQPLCNIRYTLERACDRGIASRAVCDHLVAHLQCRPFWERTLERALDHVGEQTDWRRECTALATWLCDDPDAFLDQKRRDAVELLRVLAGIDGDAGAPATDDWELADTYGWQLVYRRARGEL